ncbi:vacuolar sorting protein 9 domain-containing protein [Naegleria gruberi]|uniref:Vacuolar sorting protein 9 domain-containing protein n=1 Tax=Naegleria gruberi TaxID=5762 RepID=D2VC67_NAEGR|nr:vacuolar sorting protein 9 domain-containing protein [Naegleria gruberi]EFC45695.1 vacuolar sorting protein 9 domain-containing protein [Naegleria gruberi]|eukprot:XP_002678439.1 vacuolar sorting protein 9 domain-containing protein [Naegleria gruberi strain NEG-M]
MMNRQSRGVGSQNSIMSSSLPASGFQREFAKNNINNNINKSPSDLTFEKKDLSKAKVSEEAPVIMQSKRKRVARKRNLNLDSSLFWDILSESKQYLQSCRDAQKTICIPPDDELNYVINTLKYSGAKFQAFMKDHILSNSPLFIGEYVTDRGNQICENSELYENLSRQKKKNVSLASLGVGFNSTEENSFDFVNVLQTGKGFSKSFNVFVLKEETCYNDKYQPYKVLFVDKCIADEHQQISIGALNEYNDYSESGSEAAKWTEKRPTTVEEYHQFLQDVNYKAYNDKLKRSIQHFNFNYLLLRGFHSSIPDKIMEYYQVIYGEFQNVSLSTEEDKDVKNAIHGVLLEGIYDKLFPFLEKYAYYSEDKNFLHVCMSINAACSVLEDEETAAYDLFDVLSIGNSFRCDQLEAITFLSENINLARNPFDKMKCIKNTTDKIVNSISRFNQANSKTEFVTTDDMIPLLAYVLVRAQIPNMITNFNYMQDYQLEEEHGVSEYGFSVTTLNATIYYLKEEIYAKDESKWKKYRKLVETPKKSPSQPSLKKLDIEPFLNSPVSPLVDSPLNSESINESKPRPSRSFVSFDGNADTSITDNLLSADDQLSGLLSPRDTQRSLALKQKRQEEREKRMSIRKLESIAVIKSFVLAQPATTSSKDNLANSNTGSNSSLSRQNSMPYGLPSRNRNNF